MKLINAIRKIVFILVTVSPVTAFAAPSIKVTSRTNSAGNTEWRVFVSPDAAQFTTVNGKLGGSVAFEGTFEVIGSTFTKGLVNYTQWNTINPGHNPLTGTITKGLYFPSTRTKAYLSIGSRFFINGSPALLVTFETPGTAATSFKWGGASVLTGTPLQYNTSRVSQKGINNNNLNGTLNRGAVPDSASCESERANIASQCSQALAYRTTQYMQACSDRIIQALTTCKNYGNIYSICAEASINHERACSITNFALCGLLDSRTRECDTLLP